MVSSISNKQTVELADNNIKSSVTKSEAASIYEKVSDTSANTENANVKNVNERTQKDVDSALNTIIRNAKISLDDAKKILDYCGYSEEKLLSIDSKEFAQVLKFLIFGLKHISEKNIKDVDKKELAMTVLTYKIAVINHQLDNNDAINFVKKYEKMDLIDILQEKVPSLKGRKIDDISAQELKNIFKKIIESLPSIKNNTNNNSQAYLDMFMGAIGKCDDKEKAKIFHAFALLLKDKDMQNKIPDAYKNMLKTYGNLEELAKMIHKIGPELLRELGFDDKTIQILNFESMKNLDDKQLMAIIDSFTKAFDQIDENDLPILKKVLTSINNGQIENLTDDELRVFAKYKDLIHGTVSAISQISQRPELSEELNKHYKQLFDKLQTLNISNEVFGYVQSFFEQNKNIFQDITKDDFIKKLNKLTDNKYSEAIGDTNPDNLYDKKSTNKNDDLFKTASPKVIAQSEENIRSIRQFMADTSSQDVYTVEPKSDSSATNNESPVVEAASQNVNIKILTDIFTGKVKISKFFEQAAIKQYKLMDTAAQGNILLKATGKFFNDLVDNTKSSTLENLINAGWKGRSFDATKKVKDAIEERNDDVA